MTEESKMLSDVRTWLERGGYVLEMDVARRFAARGALVRQSTHYSDPSTRQYREIDVDTTIHDPSDPTRAHCINVIVECKATSAPWVLFVGDESPDQRAWDVLVINVERGCGHCTWIAKKLRALRLDLPLGYALAEKRGPDKQSGNNVDHPYQALQQITSAAVSKYADLGGWQGHGEEEESCATFGIPLVVTKSPLVTCTLGSGGSVNLAEVAGAQVSVHREDILGDYNIVDDGVGTLETLNVLIVNEKSLDGLIDRFVDAVSFRAGQA